MYKAYNYVVKIRISVMKYSGEMIGTEDSKQLGKFYVQVLMSKTFSNRPRTVNATHFVGSSRLPKVPILKPLKEGL